MLATTHFNLIWNLLFLWPLSGTMNADTSHGEIWEET